eukprot:XP_765455.1 hypothetical protein [Theileria parva strain Muguga]
MYDWIYKYGNGMLLIITDTFDHCGIMNSDMKNKINFITLVQNGKIVRKEMRGVGTLLGVLISHQLFGSIILIPVLLLTYLVLLWLDLGLYLKMSIGINIGSLKWTHSERFYPDVSTCSRDVDHVDKEMLLKSELEDLNQEFNRFVPGPCISKGLNYVYFKKLEDTPSKYVSEIFKEIKNNKSYSARFLSRIVPVDYICEAKEEDLRCTLKSLISKEFPLSLANSDKEGSLKESSMTEDKINNKSENKENNNSSKILEESDKGESVVTWALEFKRTNSNALGRQQVLDVVNELMGKEYKVDLKRPEKLIIVYVIKVSATH